MKIVVVRKYNYKGGNATIVEGFNHKGIKFWLYVIINKLRGYEVEYGDD